MHSAGATAALVASLLAGAIATPAQAQPTLATGRLTDAHGAPSTGVVVAYAWPLHSGTHTLREAARATAGRDGRFTLVAAVGPALARLGGPDGWLDFDLEFDTSRRHGSTVLSLPMREHADTATSTSQAPSVPFLHLAASQVGPVEARGASPVGACAQRSPVVTKLASATGPTVIGELNNAYRDTTASFSYGPQADSDIGVGVAMDGKAFSIGGSVHVANRKPARITVSRRGPYARRVLSSFRFGKYRKRYDGETCRASTIVKAERWIGGVSSRRQRHTIGVCPADSPTYSGGDEFRRFGGRALTWTRAVSAFRVGLNGRSGFSRTVQTVFKFGGGPNRTHVLCGSGGRPPPSARRLFSGRGG